VLRGDAFARVVRAATRRPLVTVAAVAVLALVGGALALRLDPSASTDTLVDRSSEEFEATERYKREFGDEAVLVLVRGNLQDTLLSNDRRKLLAFEDCIAGRVSQKTEDELMATWRRVADQQRKAGGQAPPRPQVPAACKELSKLQPSKALFGPGTFIATAADELLGNLKRRNADNEAQAKAVGESARKAAASKGESKKAQDRVAKVAYDQVRQEFFKTTLALGLRYGLLELPSFDDEKFVAQLVFDPRRGSGAPKARFAYVFPSQNAALVQARLRPDLNDSERRRALDLIRDATGEQAFRLENASYVVTGVPIVVDGLAAEVQSSILVLLIAALVVMAVTLALVFRSRPRLLPLAIALVAAALTYGLVSVAGGSLTMASIAVLPVLIGLAVDYAIQFQARYDEARGLGEDRPRAAATFAATAGGPTIASACLATAVGFLVLLLSPVPMVRGFGLMLVVGIALAFALALTAGFAGLVIAEERRGGPPRSRPADLPPALPRARAWVTAVATDVWDGVVESRPWRRAEEVTRSGLRRLRSAARDAIGFALAFPRAVLAIGLGLALVGWVADTQTKVISDVRELVPQDLRELEDVNALQRETGVSGEIDVTVRADDITKPEVVGWMTNFQERVLTKHGFQLRSSCAQRAKPPELCPAFSLPELVGTATATGPGNFRAILDAVPSEVAKGVVTREPPGCRSNCTYRTAVLAFGIRLMPLDRQKQVIDDIRRELNPPPGVEASLTGLPVLAAESNDALASPWRRLLTLLAGLAAVFLVLLAVRREPRQAAIPLIPIAFATGWSALVLYALQIPLNPLSATLGALVIAISTEFSVLLSARYRDERDDGWEPARALQRTYRSTGAAVLASGVTATAGFAALIATDIKMLRDFGIVTVVDLTVSLIGVMVVLPAALVWAEQHGPFSARDLDPRPILAGAWWGLRAGLEDLRSRARLPRPRVRLPRPRLGRLRSRA
jgi:uncharacterized protein